MNYTIIYKTNQFLLIILQKIISKKTSELALFDEKRRIYEQPP